MSDELKPCPFCGGDARLNHRHHIYNSPTVAVYVSCLRCKSQTKKLFPGTSGNRDSAKQKVIAAWNARAESK